MKTMRVDIIVTKRAGYGDEPAYWYWEAIGADAGVKVRLDPYTPKWSASVPTPHDYHAYGVTLQVDYDPARVADPGLWAEWLVDALASAVVHKNADMAGHFAIMVHKCYVDGPNERILTDAEREAAIAKVADSPLPKREGNRVLTSEERAAAIDAVVAAVDIVPKDRIIPGDLTIAELNDYIALSSKKGLRSAKQGIAHTVLDARYKGLDTVAAMKAYVYEWTTDDNVRAAVDWLIAKIPAPPETKP